MDVAIRRIAAEHVEGFHRALDQVARERKYLAFLEAPAVGETREFVIAKGYPQFVARLQPPTGLKEAERLPRGPRSVASPTCALRPIGINITSRNPVDFALIEVMPTNLS